MLAAGSTVLAAVTLLSMWLIGRRLAVGWLVAIGAQFLWVPYDLWSHQPGFLLITLASVPVYMRGWRNFRHGEEGDLMPGAKVCKACRRGDCDDCTDPDCACCSGAPDGEG
jgi:hypothetical protein